MSISISNYPVHLQDGFKPNRECLKSQGSQSEYQKVFHRDSLEVSQLSKNREILMDKIKHTVVQSAASLSDMNIKGNQGRKRAVWLFGCCECLWAELCKAVF